MRTLNDLIFSRYVNSPASEATRAKHIFTFNVIFIIACAFLIPVNIFTGDIITLTVLPLCIIITIASIFLLSKGHIATAANLALFACTAAITLDLFTSTEPPGNNIMYRGLLTFLIVMIASPLVFSGRRFSVKFGLLIFLVLSLVYFVRIHPSSTITPMHIAELANMALLLSIAVWLNTHALNVHRNYIQLLEDEKSKMESHQASLETHVLEKTTKLTELLEQLRKQEELYRSIVENSHDGIVIIDDQSIIVFVNIEMCRLTGYTFNEIVGHSFIDFIDNDCKQIVIESYKRRQRGEDTPSVYETTLVSKSGAKINGEVRVALYVTPDDRLQSVVQFLDITSRRKSEEALAMLHDLAIKLGGIIEAEQAMDLIMDALLQIDEVDSGGLYIRNVVTGDIMLAAHRGLGEPFITSVSYIHSDAPQVRLLQMKNPIYIHFSELLKSFDEQKREIQSKEGIRALSSIPLIYGGELIGALNAASHTLDEFSPSTKSTIEALAAQVSVVVARLRSETALRESERKYRNLVEQTDNIVFTADADGIITYVSPSMQNHTGYSPDEVIGHDFIRFIHPDDVEKILKKYDELMHGILSPDEYRLVAKNGKPVWIISNSQPIIVDGNFKGIIGVFTDITETKKREEERLEMERKLLHSQKLESLGVLTGGIAHDFNNLLMAMMGNIELAGLHLENDSPAKKFLAEAHHATRRAADLVRQMLVYSGKVQQNLQIIRIGKAVEDILALVKSSISKKAVFVSHLEGDKNPVRADITQIQQIAMNLIVNASEALEDGYGEIAVETGELFCDKKYLATCRPQRDLPEGNYAFLEVRDSGCGISEENIDRIFDPFFTTKFTGRGLGMAAVLGIIRAHSGGIIIESTQGKGTNVRVLFPIATQLETPDAIDEQTQNFFETAPKHSILLVDDDESVLQTGSNMLKNLGYSVIHAREGKEAIEVFRHSHNLACAIIDLSMPHMDGRAVLAEIKKINPSTICVLTSGHPREDALGNEESVKADGFLQKPFSMGDLEKLLGEVMKR